MKFINGTNRMSPSYVARPGGLSLLLAIILLLQLGAEAAPLRGKVTAVLGDSKLQKKGQGNWRDIRVGARVAENDRIRTLVESRVSLEFRDGSKVNIAENSVVDLVTLSGDDKDQNNTKFNVKQGKLLFNIKKMTNSRSSFEFETVSATAAIRGTQGGIGPSVAYLSEGRMEMRSRSGSRIMLEANQLAVMNKTGQMNVFNVKQGAVDKAFDKVSELMGQGEAEDLNTMMDSLQKVIEESESEADSDLLNTDSLVSDSLVADSLAGALLDEDTLVVDTLVADSTEVQRHGACTIGSYPSETWDTFLEVSGSCPPGTQIRAGNIQTLAREGRWSLSLFWPEGSYGIKSFALECEYPDGNVRDCGQIEIDYLRRMIPLRLSLETPRRVTVTNGLINVRGRYEGTDAQLVLEASGKSINISSSDGGFSYMMPVSDKAGNWDLDQIRLELSSPEGMLEEFIEVEVDKTSPGVNTLNPSAAVSVDTRSCQAFVTALGTLGGDELDLEWIIDGSEAESMELTQDIRNRPFPLEAGVHNYRVVVTDLAANKAEQRLASVACYPAVNFTVDVEGPRREVLRVPPPPPNTVLRYKQRLHFEIRDIPDDDPAYLQKVQIKADGRIVRSWIGEQIDRLVFDQEISLRRGEDTEVVIEIIPVNGRSKVAYKTFVFR